MFIGDWRDSMPRHAFGSLVLRDILTRGDNFARPSLALSQAANYLAYGRLQPRDSTTPSRLDGEQIVYYIVGGSGEITAGSKTAALHKDIAVFVPANLEFAMKNTGNEDLTMYVVSEPPHGFRAGNCDAGDGRDPGSGENSDGRVPLHDSGASATGRIS